MTRRILFFDPLSGGHRAQHVAAYTRAAASFPQTNLTFALNPSVVQQARSAVGAVESERVRFVEIPQEICSSIQPNNKDVPGGLKVLRYAESLATDLGVDHIFLMQLDTFLPALFVKSFVGGGKYYSGVYFRPTTHYDSLFGSKLSARESALNALKRLFVRRILSVRTTKRVLSLDPYFDDAGAAPAARAKIIPLPDIVSPPQIAIEPGDLPVSWLQKPFRFVLFGSIAERKGARQLLAAISMLPPSLAASCAFLIAGEVERDFADDFRIAMGALERQSSAAEVHSIQRFLSDEELWWLVTNSTAVLAPYQRHIGYSGVLCWSAAAGKPILTQDFGVLGWDVRKHKLGVAVDTSQPGEICAALQQICEGSEGAIADRASQSRFVEAHAEVNFSHTVLRALTAD